MYEDEQYRLGCRDGAEMLRRRIMKTLGQRIKDLYLIGALNSALELEAIGSDLCKSSISLQSKQEWAAMVTRPVILNEGASQ